MHFRREASPSVHDAPLISGASGEAFEQSTSGVLLVGFVVWSGEVVGGLLPLYEGVGPGGCLSGERFEGALIGQRRGRAQIVIAAGRAVSALAYEGWPYQGHAALRSLQLVWRPVSAGAPAGEIEVSEPAAAVRTTSPGARGHRQGTFYLDTPAGRGVGGLHGACSIHLNTLGLLTVPAIAPGAPRSRWLTPAPAPVLGRFLLG
jgi:hypothetical protein